MALRALMKRWMKGRKPEETIATMHEMVPRMMEVCFFKMSVEQRRAMLSMCRSILDDMEKAHT